FSRDWSSDVCSSDLERGVDVGGLLRDAALVGRRHRVERAHVVDAIAQLDEQHPNVAAHGYEQLAEADRLVLAPRHVRDLAELGRSEERRVGKLSRTS